MLKSKKFIFLLPVICLVLIFGFSAIPGLGNIPWARPLLFKMVAHISAFAVFTFSFFAAIEICLPKTKEPDFLETLLLTVVIVIIAFIVALFSEYFQTFIPGRGGCLRDVGFDSIGILLALGAWFFIKIRKRR